MVELMHGSSFQTVGIRQKFFGESGMWACVGGGLIGAASGAIIGASAGGFFWRCGNWCGCRLWWDGINYYLEKQRTSYANKEDRLNRNSAQFNLPIRQVKYCC